MKLNLFDLKDTNAELIVQLPDFFDAWEKEVNAAEPIFKLEGERLELIARNIPYHQQHYASLALEAKSVVKWLENYRARTEARYLKNYHNSPRALGVKEQSQYISGEKEIVELNQLIIQTELLRQKFDEIVEAIRQMAWMVGHITKLRVAELQDAVI